MSTEDAQEQRNSLGSSAKAAAKTGKAVSNIVKGAASSGLSGAALLAGKNKKKWLIPIACVLLIPVIIIAMLPTIIFGAIFGDGSDTKNGIADGEVLTQNMVELNDGISSVLSEGLADVLERIDADFAASGCDQREINNPYGSGIRFNANFFISMYCSSKDADVESISKDELLTLIRDNKDKLYSFTYRDEQREVDGEPDPETHEVEKITITVRIYTISYNGEAYFEDSIFSLTDAQKSLAVNYAQNLSVLLSDGSYQGLSDTEFTSLGVSYVGVVFSDGSTPVVYYNQIDERWKDLPYGTDDIGHYGCGPTSMAMVVSSLTSETVDPPHMAQWAYENGHWCSKSGSYNSVVTGAAQAWGLSVTASPRTSPQPLIDALSSGKLVVAIMGPGHFTKHGHFIVLRGVTSDGKVLVADPASRSRSGTEWDMAIITSEASRNASGDCPFWIISN